MGHNQSRRTKSSSNSPIPETQSNTTTDTPNMNRPPLPCTSPPLSNELEILVTPSQEDSATHSPAVGLLNQDSDFDLLCKFLDERTSTSDSEEIDSGRLFKVLAASARVLSKFPTNIEAVVLVTGAVLPLCAHNLPLDPPSILMEVQMNALEAFSQLNVQSNPSLIDPAIGLIVLLWSRYPSYLPAACNIKQLAQVLNASLQVKINGEVRAQDAVKYGQTFVNSLMLGLSDSQLEALEAEGVFKSLQGLLHLYQEMSEDALKQIVIGVGMFTEMQRSSQSFIDENVHFSLMFAAQMYSTHSALQQVIWRLLILVCARDRSFIKTLDNMNILLAVVTIMKTEGSHLSPLLEFLTGCCQIDESRFIPKCLYLDELMQHLLEIVQTDPQSTATLAVDDIKNSCEFISFICSRSPSSCLPRLMDLNLVSRLEVCAGHWPTSCLLPACVSVEGIIKCLSVEQSKATSSLQTECVNSMIKEFNNHDHHEFLTKALSNPNVYSSPTLLDLVYLTLQKILKLVTPEALEKMCSKEFLELYVSSFVRDTSMFPDHSNRIIFVTHYFLFQIKQKEAIDRLRELNFHTPIVDLVRQANSYDTMCSAMALLSCVIGKYLEFLKDVKPFLEANVPAMLVEKANKYGKTPRSQFGDDFSRIILNLTAEKEQSLQLYNEGLLEQLLEMAEVDYVPVIKRCIIHAIGNIALGGQCVKEVLYTKRFHTNLLGTLRKEAEKGDPSLLSACCRVLHILSSGDAAKRLFVENGCVEVLIKIMKTRRENPEVCWRPLGLLSSLSFMAVVNGQFVLTRDVIEAVVKILKEENHGKIFSYTMLVFLAYLQMDWGTVSLRQLSIENRIKEVICNADYQKHASELERWGSHVLEKQNLYTFAIPQNCSLTVADCRPEDTLVSDWPPRPSPAPARAVSPSSSGKRQLLPLDKPYLFPHTPLAIELTTVAKERLSHLGLDPDKPLFRIGRVYGSTHGWCTNCDKEGTAYEMVIRVSSMTPTQYQHLIDNGWYRRGGVKMFRMMFNHSLDCCDWETRVHANKFDYRSRKSYRKVCKRMPENRLTIETKPKHFSKEAFDLYNTYHIHRHQKPQKSEFSYCEHVVESPIMNQVIDGVEYGTFHQLYYLDKKLVGVGIIDVVPKGIVSIYMWYDIAKEISKFSFGVYSALKEIEYVQELSKANPTMQYYYLQGWNKGNPKLSYKAMYTPEDFYCPGIVSDWVASREQVEVAVQRVIDKKQQTEAVAIQQQASKESTLETNQMEVKEARSQAAGGNVHSCDGQETEDEGSKEADKVDDQRRHSNEASKDKKTKYYSCEAVDNDCLKHGNISTADVSNISTADISNTTVDVSKIVVCLNYSQYMYLGDVFTHFQLPVDQQKVMKKRFTELFLALSPELTSQLVIDLKACSKRGALQVCEHADKASQQVMPVTERMQTDTSKLVV